MMIYFAPMEGVTDYIFRNTYAKYFDGVDKFFTPFLSPSATHSFSSKELANISKEKCKVSSLVPQLLTNNAEHFNWAAKYISDLDFKEINLNLGCPSGTVTAKGKGSGFLRDPKAVDNFLYDIFDKALKEGYELSIKTRLGYDNPDVFYELMDIYNKYPIKELTVHPRIRNDQYKGSVRMEYFDYAYKISKNPLVYNGDITSLDCANEIISKYPELSAIMIGRGLITYPELSCSIKGKDVSKDTFRSFMNELMLSYKEVLSGDYHLLQRMKEFWGLIKFRFPEHEKEIKNLLKAKTLSEYKLNADLILK